MNRRELMTAAGAAGMMAALPRMALAAPNDGLASITTRVVPISVAERQQRIARLQQLMRSEKLTAVLIEPGASAHLFHRYPLAPQRAADGGGHHGRRTDRRGDSVFRGAIGARIPRGARRSADLERG